MLLGYPKVLQSLMGTLLTWGVTAAGAGLVFVLRGEQVSSPCCVLSFASHCPSLRTTKPVFILMHVRVSQRKVLDVSLGFAAGVSAGGLGNGG